VRACVEQLVVIEKETAELAAAEKGLADARDQHERKLMDKNDLQLKKEVSRRVYPGLRDAHVVRQRAEQQRANAQERLERAKQVAADKQTAYSQKLARLKAESEQLVMERRENDREVEALVSEADAIEREMATHLRESQERLDELVDSYWDLREQHSKCHYCLPADST
jgi:kinetochore protein Nuf2